MNDTQAYTHEVELRASSGKGNHLLSGYAIVYSSPSENMGFIEQVHPKALEGVDLSRVFALYNHDFNNVLGRSGKNLSLKTDDKGLYFELELLPSDEHVFELVQSGIINKMSFGFNVEADEWSDATHRTITKIKTLKEISLVPVPAYEGTDIKAVRSLDMATADKQTENELIDVMRDEFAQLKALLTPKDAPVTEERDEEEPEPVTDVTPEAMPTPVEDDETRNLNIDVKDNEQMTQAKVVDATSVEIRNFNEYLENGEKRGLTTVSGAPIVPQELLAPQFQPQASTGLLGLINTHMTTTNVGSLPVVKHAAQGLTKATEGADVAEVDAPAIVSVDYHLNLYSGQIPLTYELARSSKDASGIVLKHITAMRDLTRLNQVGALLAKAKGVNVVTIDDLKAIANNDDLADYADKAFVVTSDFYNWLDQQKDAQGQYLLQPSIVEGSQKTLFGYPLYQVKNAVLGGGQKAFFGSVHDFALEVINENMIFSYQENRDLTQRAVGGVFADWQVADEESGVFVTVTAPASK